MAIIRPEPRIRLATVCIIKKWQRLDRAKFEDLVKRMLRAKATPMPEIKTGKKKVAQMFAAPRN